MVDNEVCYKIKDARDAEFQAADAAFAGERSAEHAAIVDYCLRFFRVEGNRFVGRWCRILRRDCATKVAGDRAQGV